MSQSREGSKFHEETRISQPATRNNSFDYKYTTNSTYGLYWTAFLPNTHNVIAVHIYAIAICIYASTALRLSVDYVLITV